MSQNVNCDFTVKFCRFTCEFCAVGLDSGCYSRCMSEVEAKCAGDSKAMLLVLYPDRCRPNATPHTYHEIVKRLLVDTLVFPHVRYCMSTWGSCTTTQGRRLQESSNFGVRVVTGLGYREHVTDALRELN